jgi:hypothetical protein
MSTTTLPLAQAELFGEMVWGDIVPQEMVVIARLNYRCVNGSAAHNAQLEAIQFVYSIGGGTISTGGSIGPVGAQGLTGAQGVTGNTGNTGVQGPIGPRTVNYVIGSNGVISTGATESAQSKGYIFFSQAARIDRWQLFANGAGNVRVDVWSGAYAGGNAMPTMTMISGTNPPQLNATQANSGSNTGWTTSTINAGNVVQFRVNTSPTVTVSRVTLAFNVSPTT